MLSELLRRIDENQTRINRYRPFEDEAMLREIQKFYRVATVFSSNALEGYSYSLSETKILLEDGLTAGGKPLRDAFAVVGLGHAYDHMFSLQHHSGITEQDVLKLHGMLKGSLDNDAVAGAYRRIPVFISGSRYPASRPEDVESRMRGLLARASEERETLHPLVVAARFHKDFVFIHPFSDGNGRIARLAMNMLLIQQGYLPVVIPPVLRHDYVAALEKAHEDDGSFLELMARSEIETQKDFLRLVRDADAPRNDEEVEKESGKAPRDDCSRRMR